MTLEDVIISVLTESPRDQYSIFRKLGGKSAMSEIVRSITKLQNAGRIHVAGYRRNSRTGLDIPIYNTVPREDERPDFHRLLAGVTSERLVEYDFVSRNLLPKTADATIVDIGSGGSALASSISKFGRNFRVYSIDLGEYDCDARMDARSTGLRDGVADQVICVSAMEHVGLSCGIRDESGDIQAMKEIFRILKYDGSAIVTVPYGSGYSRSHRVYDRKNLGRLIKGFSIARIEFYRHSYGKWKKCSKASAEKAKPRVPEHFHNAACACMLLKK
ncbi:MAG TPA: methyltransferase domain-containing protein [Nitrososphaera sp.]